MKYVIDPLKGLLIALFGLFVAPIAMLPLCLLIKWDSEPTTGGDGGEYSRTIRGDLRILGSIFATPDERFPGGLNEPTVVKWLEKYGKTWCSYLWAGTRNRAMGLAQLMGHETTDYIPEGDGYWERGDIWRYGLTLGPVRIVIGWQVYGNVGPLKQFWAVPLFTIKNS